MSYTVETTSVGDGHTKLFGFSFEVALTDSVNVEVDGTAVPFTVSGSSVELAVAPAAGAVVRIYRSTNLDALRYQYQLGAPFLPSTVDANNIQLLYALQESQFNVARFYDTLLRVPSTDAAIAELPTATLRAGKLLTFDADGQPVVAAPASGSIEELKTLLASPTGAAHVGTRAGTVADSLSNLSAGVSTNTGSIATLSGSIATLSGTVAGKQDYSALLTALAAVQTAADKLIYATGANQFTTATLTPLARTLLACTDQVGLRSVVGAINSGDVPTIIAGQGVGGVGTYALASVGGATLAPGQTLSGSLLRYSSADDGAISQTYLPGAWMCMGYTSGTSYGKSVTLFKRIS